MSMWEIEYLVEDGIRIVDLMTISDAQKRNLIWNLYEIQKEWDCGFTNFRVMEILQKVEYTKFSPLEDHRSYAQYRSFFDTLKKGEEFAFIYLNPIKKAGDRNPTVAYWDPDTCRIYYDFGTVFWDGTPNLPTEMDVISVAEVIVSFADSVQNKAAIYDWSAFVVNFVFEDIEETKKRLKNIRTLFKKYDYSEHEPVHGSLELKVTEWCSDLTFWFLEVDK